MKHSKVLDMKLGRKNERLLDWIGTSSHSAEDGWNIEGVATFGYGHVAITEHLPNEYSKHGRW